MSEGGQCVYVCVCTVVQSIPTPPNPSLCVYACMRLMEARTWRPHFLTYTASSSTY